MNIEDLAQLRKEYSLHELDEQMVASDPVDQFKSWFEEALQAEVNEPNAFTLSTCGKSGWPSGRIVLLKEIIDQQFVFYTNYESDKAREMAENPQIAMTFLWHELQRQVRIKGNVQKNERHRALHYFQSRPFESQLGAWASPQSRIIENRSMLENQMADMRKQYEGQDKLPLPDHWGGYQITPVEFEFWQGRRSRLHDRIKYINTESGWIVQRIAP